MSSNSPVNTLKPTAINYNAGGQQDRLLLGIVLMVLGESLFVLMGAIIKHTSVDLPIIQVMFFRNFFALLFLTPLIYRIGFVELRSANIKLHLLRTLLGVLAMMCIFYSYSSLKLSEASLLKATSPVLISLMAWMVLREKLNLLTWLAIILAFCGVAVIFQPDSSVLIIKLGVISGLVSSLLGGLAKIVVRQIGRVERSEVIVFYFALFASLITLPLMIYYWHDMGYTQTGMLMLMALFGATGQLAITKAYTVAKAGLVGLFSYVSVPIAGMLGWLLWQETIDNALILGTVIIVAAGLLSFIANRKRKT